MLKNDRQKGSFASRLYARQASASIDKLLREALATEERLEALEGAWNDTPDEDTIRSLRDGIASADAENHALHAKLNKERGDYVKLSRQHEDLLSENRRLETLLKDFTGE